jgi:prohibitin 2
MSDSALRRVARTLERGWIWLRTRSLTVYAATLAALLVLIALAPFMFVAVPAGHVGVVWSRFDGGTMTEKVLYEGTHVILPWDTMTLYDARVRNNTVQYDAITGSGVIVQIEVSLRYHINPSSAALLHKLVGPRYSETYVYPKVGSLVYELASRADPETLYSTQRSALERDLLKGTRAAFAVPPPDVERRSRRNFSSLVVIDDLMVSAVVLPAWVRQAIDRKLEQQQIMQEYDFRLARESKEAQRKRIEAEGIRDFQATVARNITPSYLRLRGIEATQVLANSPNAKMIIIGGRDGLPVILNTGEDERPAPAAQPARPR